MIQISQLYHKQYILYFTRIVQAITIFEQQLIRGGGGGGGAPKLPGFFYVFANSVLVGFGDLREINFLKKNVRGGGGGGGVAPRLPDFFIVSATSVHVGSGNLRYSGIIHVLLCGGQCSWVVTLHYNARQFITCLNVRGDINSWVMESHELLEH